MRTLLLLALRNCLFSFFFFLVALPIVLYAQTETPPTLSSGVLSGSISELKILQDLVPPAPKDRLEIEAKTVFRFDQADAEALFLGSKWVILPDRFGFLPPPAFLNTVLKDEGPTDVPHEAVPEIRLNNFLLFGRVRNLRQPGGEILELHGTQEGTMRATFTIDGFVRPEDGHYALDAVYSFSLRGLQQVGHVRLHLDPVRTSPSGQDKPSGSVFILLLI